MKKNVGITIGTAAIVTLFFGTLVTSTYAWFVTNNQGKMNLTNVGIYQEGGNLKIEYVNIADGAITGESHPADSDGNISISGKTQAIHDVSGNGLSFYRPEWKLGEEQTSARYIYQVTNSSTDYYYIRFGLKISNDGNTNFNVYLNGGSSITGHETTNSTTLEKNNRLASCMRVSIRENDSNNTPLTMWQYSADTSYKYLKEEEGGSAYGTDTGFTLANADVDYSSVWHLGNFVTKTTVSDVGDEKGSNLGTIPANSNKTVIVTAWIEGTNSHADMVAAEGSCDIALKFIAM